MSHEEILKYNSKRAASKKVRGKRDKINLLNKKQIKKEKSQQIKLPDSKIYDPSDNSRNQQRNLPLVADDSKTQDQQRQKTITDAKEITDYYFTFHKSMINIYNSICCQMLQDISNSYKDSYLTANEMIIDYSTQIENIYNGLISKKDKSLKLVDNIITENIDTYIKSIELKNSTKMLLRVI